MISSRHPDGESSFWRTGIAAITVVTLLALILIACAGDDEVGAVETEAALEPTEAAWPPPPDETE